MDSVVTQNLLFPSAHLLLFESLNTDLLLLLSSFFFFSGFRLLSPCICQCYLSRVVPANIPHADAAASKVALIFIFHFLVWPKSNII